MTTVWLPLAAPLLLLGAPDEILWEKNRGWADTGFTYFQGSRCDPGGSCPREMGWQGNDLTLTFALPSRGDGFSEVRFEVVVERVLNPVTVSVTAGPAGGLRPAGSLRLASAGIQRLLIAAADLRWGGLNEVRLRGDNPVGFGQPSGVRWTAFGLYRNFTPPPAISDEVLLDDTQWRACRYFYEQTLPRWSKGPDPAGVTQGSG